MLIQDIKPPVRKLDSLKTETMVEELFLRGVTIAEIFGQYYAMEAMADARHDDIFGNDEEGLHGRQPLTVSDAYLAGVVSRPTPGLM